MTATMGRLRVAASARVEHAYVPYSISRSARRASSTTAVRLRMQRRERVVRRHAVRRVLARVGLTCRAAASSSRSRASTARRTLCRAAAAAAAAVRALGRGHAARDTVSGIRRSTRCSPTPSARELGGGSAHEHVERSTPSTSSSPSATAATLRRDADRLAVDAYTRGYVGDEQMAAMTMAIFIRGWGATRSATSRWR
jgi:hypothetical protein